MKLRSLWPRGRHNGRRIVGFTVKLRVDVLGFRLLPHAEWGYGAPMVRWLVFALFAEAVYHWSVD